MALVLLIAIAVLAVILLVLTLKAPPYTNAPHEPGYPIIGNTIQILKEYDVGLDCAVARTKKFGLTWCQSLMGTPLFVYTADPKNVQYMLKDNFENYEKGSEFRAIFYELLGHGIFNVDGEEWFTQRKVASKMFNLRNFRDNMVEVFTKHALKLCNKLEQIPSDTRFDLQDLFFRVTLDSIGVVGFGHDFHSLDGDNKFMNAFDFTQKHIVRRFVTPFWRLFKYISPTEYRFKFETTELHNFAKQIVKNRKEEGYEGQLDLLSIFMSKNGPEAYSEEFYKDLVLNFTLAGRDTTAQALSWMFYMIGTHPEVEKKAQQEIDEVLGKSVPNFETIKKLKYIDAIFSETVRLYPSVPMDGKMAVNDDVLPDGTIIKKGVWMNWMPYVMGRLDQLWPNAEKFDPDRWFLEENEKVSPFKFISFNAGPRTCLGQNMAYLEGKCVAAMILQRFTIRVAPGGKIRPQTNVTLPMDWGFPAVVERRKN